MKNIGGLFIAVALAATVGLSACGATRTARSSKAQSVASPHSQPVRHSGEQWAPAKLSSLRAEIMDRRLNH
jgi:hypothetical protein